MLMCRYSGTEQLLPRSPRGRWFHITSDYKPSTYPFAESNLCTPPPPMCVRVFLLSCLVSPQRVFIHYVLGKMLLLFFLCHPGTLATCDGQAYLRNRYANRDLVTTESELVSYAPSSYTSAAAENIKLHECCSRKYQNRAQITSLSPFTFFFSTEVLVVSSLAG